MLNIEIEILELARDAGEAGPSLPAPEGIAPYVDRLLGAGLLRAVDGPEGRIVLEEAGFAMLQDDRGAGSTDD